jgi:polynucleotide 5'-hydroxyl-kinase GRC3/NOL9
LTEGWQAVARAVVAAPGTVMMLGAVDVGKTTTATRIAGEAVRAGLRTAVVDADIGQSDLGPPAAVGLGFVRAPVRHIADVPPAGLWFAGDTSAPHVYRYLVEGTLALTARAGRQGAQIVVVDTTGWVEGAGAAAKLRKIRRLRPRHLVAIQRDREVEAILAHVPAPAVVHRLRPAPGVRVRTPRERRAARERQFAEYFASARQLDLDARRVVFERPAVYGGGRVPGPRVITEVPAAALRHLLVGLVGRRGTMMAMGTIVHVEPAMHRLSVVAAGLRPGGAVRTLHWGNLRVTPEGREAGRLSDPVPAAT